jgi:hypothetical protein
MPIIHSTRHVILSFGGVEEFDDRLRFDVNIIREDDLVISALLHQGFEDTISKSRKKIDAIIAAHVVRLCDRFVLRQYTPRYTHEVQSFIQLLKERWRSVIAPALEDGDEDIVCSEVMNGFDDAVGPIGYNLFIIVKHSADKYFFYRSISEGIQTSGGRIHLHWHIQPFWDEHWPSR